MVRSPKKKRMTATFPKEVVKEIQSLADADKRSFNSMLNILIDRVLFPELSDSAINMKESVDGFRNAHGGWQK
jgi:hypothetical protein